MFAAKSMDAKNSYQENSDCYTGKPITLTKKQSISHVCKKGLPNGYIHKQSPGMGATECELKAPRNSIIVMPTKSLAATKSQKFTGSLYVGSKYNKDIVKPEESDIKNYLEANDPQFKKILVVADSLAKVIDAASDEIYSKYFLMLDEIDSFQSESTYRSSLEDTIDYYHKFDNKCMVTATPIEFTEENLKEAYDRRTPFNRDSETKEEATIINTNNSLEAAYETILKIRKEKPDDKIAIFHSSVNEIMNLIKKFSKELQDKTKVLCGEGSSAKAESYFDMLETGNILPGEMNFLTSAYYSGIDINETFHLIIVTNSSYTMTLLTPQQIKQIIGRSREGNLSITIIRINTVSNISHNQKHSISTLEEAKEFIQNLRNEADKLMSLSSCIHSILNSEIILNKKAVGRNLMSNLNSNNKENFNLIRVNLNDELKPANFTFDSYQNFTKSAVQMYIQKDSFNYFKSKMDDEAGLISEFVEKAYDSKQTEDVVVDYESKKIEFDNSKKLLDKHGAEILNDFELLGKLTPQIKKRVEELDKLHVQFSSIKYIVENGYNKKEKILVKQAIQYATYMQNTKKIDNDRETLHQLNATKRFLNYFEEGESYNESQIKEEVKKLISIGGILAPKNLNGLTEMQFFRAFFKVPDRGAGPEKKDFTIKGSNPIGIEFREKSIL